MFDVRSNYGRGWRVLGAPECPSFDHRTDAQAYADLRKAGYDHTRAWNEVYREGAGGQAGDNSMGR